MSGVNGKALAATGAGALFVYAGLSGFSVLKAAQNLIQGQPANAGQTEATLAASVTTGTSGGGSIGPGASKAKAYAKAHLADYGWGVDQYAPLVTLWNGESGWDYKAENPHSGAYGIPQALPGAKMASAGADWKTNPATQIRWGLGYIKDRYGSPAAALAFWQAQSPHWY